jgi:hypothetical protein
MSILITETHANNGLPVWAGDLPGGLTSNLTWGAVGGLYKATISNISPSLSASSLLSCTLQDATETDGLNCWLVKAVPNSLNGGSIVFYTAGNPGTPGSFKISWSVVRF